LAINQEDSIPEEAASFVVDLNDCIYEIMKIIALKKICQESTRLLGKDPNISFPCGKIQISSAEITGFTPFLFLPSEGTIKMDPQAGFTPIWTGKRRRFSP
jgi:hypothetical protein